MVDITIKEKDIKPLRIPEGLHTAADVLKKEILDEMGKGMWEVTIFDQDGKKCGVAICKIQRPEIEERD